MQTKTNKIIKTSGLPQITGDKDEPNIAFMQNTELRT